LCRWCKDRISQERTLSLRSTFWPEHLDHIFLLYVSMAAKWVWKLQREIKVLGQKSGELVAGLPTALSSPP
jgi:hypothetical protein